MLTHEDVFTRSHGERLTKREFHDVDWLRRHEGEDFTPFVRVKRGQHLELRAARWLKGSLRYASLVALCCEALRDRAEVFVDRAERRNAHLAERQQSLSRPLATRSKSGRVRVSHHQW